MMEFCMSRKPVTLNSVWRFRLAVLVSGFPERGVTMLGPMKQGDLFATERAYKEVRATLLERPENPAVIVRHLKQVVRECIASVGPA
jgi:hypothetical protein